MTHRITRRWFGLVAAASLLSLGGCLWSSDSSPAPAPRVSESLEATASASEPTSSDGKDPAKAPAKELIISAAASTREVIEALVAKFQAQSGIPVTVNPGPSSGLASQILAGAPADLFLSANQKWADEVDKGNKSEVQARLLTNSLVIVVPKGNPAGIKGPNDLTAGAVKKIALAGESVPAGMYADQALARLKLLEPLVSTGKIVRGQDVRNALSFVERGEAEAGIVYSTDLAAAPNVTKVHEFDASLHDEIVYVLVLVKSDAPNPAARQLFEFLQSADSDAEFSQFGFTRLR